MTSLFGGSLPPFRQDVEVTPITHEGQAMFVLTDVLGLDPESVAVAAPVLAVASLFDGTKTAADVRAQLVPHNIILSEEEILRIAEELDKFGLLETETSRARRKDLFQRFQQSPVRPMPVKERGLPENTLDLAVFLGKFYMDPRGPGEISADGSGPTPLGLIAPHIDLFRGGPQYAWAYGELSKRRPPDVIVALGVAHISPRSPWVMTKKAYETPFGPMEVDTSLYEEIRSTLWYDPLEEEWVHAKEHSLEFQALWLKYLWRKDTPKWVPILCSTYERYCPDRPPSTVDTIEKALRDIGGVLERRAKSGQRILVLAGVDFAHVGRKFGDEYDVTSDVEKKIETADRASLEDALKLDADRFFLAGVGDGSWRKVCGLSAIYTSLRWIKSLSNGTPPKGRLLAYGQAPDPAGGAVSFASAVFDR